MADTSFMKKLWGLMLVLGMLTSISGCVKDVVTKKEPFFEKWGKIAETATGHSPAPTTKKLDVAEDAQKGKKSFAEDVEAVEVRQLPTRKITLKMRQADVKALIRALALGVGQNILIKNEVKGEITVDFEGVPWDQAFKSILQSQGLGYKWEGNIIRIMTIQDKEQEELKRKAQEVSVKQIQPLLTKVISINYADAKGLKENLQEFLKDKEGKRRGSVHIDEHSNSLIIQAVQDDLERIMPIINEIDKPTPQVLIRANIVEATKDTARNLGVTWGGMYSTKTGGYRTWLTPGGTAGTGDPIGGTYTPASGSMGLSNQGFALNVPQQMAITGTGTLGLVFGAIGGNILEMQLNALQKEGKLNILSSPSITTLDNQTAYTENGERVPYITEEVSSTGATTRSVKFENVVLRLEITPHVIDGKNLKMKVVVKKDEVDSSRSVSGNPFILKKETNTNLIVQDGETIVISGLTKQKKQDSQVSVPWLGDIPLLGWLFKGAGKSESMEEVLIFITPTILPPVQMPSAMEKSPLPKLPVNPGQLEK